MNSPDNNALQKFYTTLCQDTEAAFLTAEEGGSKEQIFTEAALLMLTDAGETENFRLCFDEKTDRAGKVLHRINGYALSEGYENLDVFITIYRNTEEISAVPKAEADTALNRIVRFLKNAFNGYHDQIEESSEIFDFARTLYTSKEVAEFLTRINIFIITDGSYRSAVPVADKFRDIPLYIRVTDIEYLCNLSEKTRIPLETDFEGSHQAFPCIKADTQNEDYQSYLAVIPGSTLAELYEQYGSRMLEQNVRSFLQFTGKINKGIRSTIIREPYMFFAFNNGIAATAEEVRLTEDGKHIAWIKDLQIVNGGQTTASVYHTWKKDKADISAIQIQMKLTVVKNRDRFSEIVSRISEYANTQNKVSVSDLSSNRRFHIELEKLSRNLWVSPQPGQTSQTRWFYERARGQYKNALIKEGFTPSKRKAFELKNPKNQVFTKEELARYSNTYQETIKGNKTVAGPFSVVRGNQKNYIHFMAHLQTEKPDNIFFEDLIAKAVVFRTAEKIYGVKPNAIGDMRFITVPYTVAWLGYRTGYRLDLLRIWKSQMLPDILKEKLREIMLKVEQYIRNSAPGSLHTEWAKKEECWQAVKNEDFGIDLEGLESCMNNGGGRRHITQDELADSERKLQAEKLREIPHGIWTDIENWGRLTGKLTRYQTDMAGTVNRRIKNRQDFSDIELSNGLLILETVFSENTELLSGLDEKDGQTITGGEFESGITMELVKKMIAFDRKHKCLKDHYFTVLLQIARGEKSLTGQTKVYAEMNLKRLKNHGFKE
jgi:hypothetical protein